MKFSLRDDVVSLIFHCPEIELGKNEENVSYILFAVNPSWPTTFFLGIAQYNDTAEELDILGEVYQKGHWVITSV